MVVVLIVAHLHLIGHHPIDYSLYLVGFLSVV
jgi:hypothetical protein